MSSLPASMRKIRSKMKSVLIRHFPHYKSMGTNFSSPSRASNSKGNIPIWPKFKLRRDFMPDPVTCKFDEDPIKTEGTIDQKKSLKGK